MLKLPRPLESIAVVSLLTFAFVFNWLAANRGIFFYDASIVFDGAWRILQGQTPYKDFAMSHAPLAYYLLAGAFRVFGVSYATFTGFASVLNMVGVWASIRIVRRLAPGWELLAGVLTAVWYQSMPGCPQIEQVAMLFDFLSLAVLLEAADSSSRKSFCQRVLAGALFCAAFLSKQNAGGLFLPVLAAVLLLQPGQRWRLRIASSASFAFGVALLATLVALWLWLDSNLAAFLRYVFLIPARFGGGRLRPALLPGALFHQLFLGQALPTAFRAANFAAQFALGSFLLFAAWRRAPLEAIPLQRAAVLLAILGYHYLLCASMWNQAENGLPFVGLQIVLTVVLLRAHWRWSTVPLLAVTAGLWLTGAHTSWARTVNEFPPGATFNETLLLPQAEWVHWGTPTTLSNRLTEGNISRTDFEDLVHYLEIKDRNFFVFPATTILYGFLAKPSPVPWLYFLEGHSFATEDLPQLDRQALANLQRLNVCIWIRETSSWLGEHKQYGKIPLTAAWLAANFQTTTQFGPYEIRERANCPQ